ncbi:putative DASH complex subunit Dad3 [Lyophyllum shimeji]|uniref:DASH complex subunit DAD3 n=1 Tax=Lyophyllum shimeji TaxID=47721 RepID=A0A9P3PF24_LYOSH|nr:putative DASH complex subunit Dad3 [Lyophyllum shimeji]
MMRANSNRTTLVLASITSSSGVPQRRDVAAWSRSDPTSHLRIFPVPTNDIFHVNPYESHPSLTATEAEVLWEYAKLAQHVKLVTQKTRFISEEPDQMLLARLRVLEKKMGLVLTLFKASVWGVINEQPVADPSGSYDDSSNDRTVRH